MKFHKEISILSEFIQILLNVTEFPNLPASLTDAMQCFKCDAFRIELKMFMKFRMMFLIYKAVFTKNLMRKY